MTLPRISLDPATPDSLYTGAQKINQVIEATENHIRATNNPHQVTVDQIGAETPAGAQAKVEAHVSDNMPHRATDPSTGKVYRWGLAIQNGEWGIIYEEVV